MTYFAFLLNKKERKNIIKVYLLGNFVLTNENISLSILEKNGITEKSGLQSIIMYKYYYYRRPIGGTSDTDMPDVWPIGYRHA